MRFSDLLDRAEAKELTQAAAAEVLGINVRTFQRWAERFEAEGDDGLVDRRMGRRSPRRAPAEELERMLGLFRDKYADFTVKHFHEQLQKRHGYVLGYTVTKLALHAAGLVRKAPKRSAHRKKRPRRPLPGMLLHQDGSRHAWIEGLSAMDLIVTMDDATSEIYSIFLIEEEGAVSTFQALGEVIGERQRSVLRALHRSRKPLLLHPEGWREGLEDATNPSRTGFIASWDRAYRGVFAGGARALRADVRHAAGPAAEGPAARRDQDGRSRQHVAESVLHGRA